MADEKEDDKGKGGEVFHFKTLVPRILKKRERDKKGAKDERLFTMRKPEPAPDKDARVIAIDESKADRERRVWGGRLRTGPIEEAVRQAFKPVTELSIRLSLVRRMVFALPPWVTANRVTAFRTLLLAPIVAYLFFKRYDDATLLYGFAMFLDFVDGAIAKNREHKIGEDAARGAMYDSTADKIVNCGVLTWFLYKELLPSAGVLLSLITMFFALANVAVRCYKMATSGDETPKLAASDAGKIKLVLETIAILLIMQALARAHVPTMEFGLLALTLATMFAVWSFREQCRFS